MHVVHPFLLPSIVDRRLGRELAPVWEVSRFRPARGVKFSAGVDTGAQRASEHLLSGGRTAVQQVKICAATIS
jgi:hypothetical protein